MISLGSREKDARAKGPKPDLSLRPADGDRCSRCHQRAPNAIGCLLCNPRRSNCRACGVNFRVSDSAIEEHWAQYPDERPSARIDVVAEAVNVICVCESCAGVV